MSVDRTVNERLAALTAAGTSVWLDQIRRSMIESGELQRMVEEDSLRGVTSNPAIFEKAILGSRRLRRRARGAGARGPERARDLPPMAVHDVQLACDVLRPVYDETGGADGYVSLEVAPRLAHDTEGTLEQARAVLGPGRPAERDDQDPGHRRGLPAIEEALYEGININVTLLFAVAAYERVMEAFIRALERRHEEGKPLDRHSVASFFVSRVDTEVDKRLEALGRTELAGPRRARQRPRRLPARSSASSRASASPRCATPAARSSGRCGPRPASRTRSTPRRSTSTAWSARTRSTRCRCRRCWPRAQRRRGRPARRPPRTRRPTSTRCASAGIDLDDVTDQLLRDGIEAFLVPMAKLLDGIERKREAVVTGRPAAIEADLPPELEQPLAERVQRAADEDVARRIWAARRHAVGAGGHARGHRPPRLADDRRQDARGGRRARALRRRGARPTG